MNRDSAERATLSVGGQLYEFALTNSRMPDHEMRDELSFVRREAQAEADMAYLDWLEQPREKAYVVYRAAQDRADAAQDDLAACVRRLMAARARS